jgi:propanol-preferring alcohol dehydrogenase
MKAWSTGDHAGALEFTDVPTPEPRADELLIEVSACGVCRTDLHVIDRELPVHRPHVVPGHQIVGIVKSVGADVHTRRVGDVVGGAWLRRTCGVCGWCRSGRENLCPASEYTGWDADGGFAEYTTLPESFAYPLSGDQDPVATAPLLCAGLIGYRALSRAKLPPGGRLGLYGFGSSAHITAELAIAQGAQVYAMTRGEANRELARRMGASFVGDATASPPDPLDAAIIFAPAGELVPLALQSLANGGTAVVAGIHVSEVPAMDYQRNLFGERDLRCVTANTRADGDAFLRLARQLHIAPTVTLYSFDAVSTAVDDLREGRTSGSLVIAAVR